MTAIIEPVNTAPLSSALHMIATLATLSTQQTLLQLGLWQMVRRRRQDYQRRLHQLRTHRDHETDPSQTLDPDDTLTDELLAIQKNIKSTVGILQSHPKSWLGNRTRQELIRLHGALGDLRIWIMEHDADCSPIIDEAFETPEALLAALRKDATG